MRLYKLGNAVFQNNTNALSVGIITEDNAFVLNDADGVEVWDNDGADVGLSRRRHPQEGA